MNIDVKSYIKILQELKDRKSKIEVKSFVGAIGKNIDVGVLGMSIMIIKQIYSDKLTVNDDIKKNISEYYGSSEWKK